MLASEWKLEDALRIREEEGIQKGRQEGIQKGRQEEKLEILKLFDAGYSTEDIRERLKSERTYFDA